VVAKESEVKGYKIGQVAKMLDLPASVLRFWETEFDQLKPEKTDGGQRLYSERDIAVARTIRHLLYEEKFTISGARKELARSVEAPPDETVPPTETHSIIGSIRHELQNLLSLIDRKISSK
jgi:DNA-binding transcriptional MerR regulator